MRSFKRTLGFLRPYRWMVITAVLFTLVVTILQIIPPRLFQFTIDSGIEPVISTRQEIARLQNIQVPTPAERGELEAAQSRLQQLTENDAPQTLLWLAGSLLGIIVLRSFLQFQMSKLVATIGHRFCFDLRFATWRHLQRLSLNYHKQTQTGKIMSRATADIELIQGLIQGQLVTFLSDVITLLAVIGMLFYLEWRIGLIILILVPFYVLAYMSFLKHIREVRVEQRRLYDVMVGKLAEKIEGVTVVKAFVKEEEETASFMESVREKFAMDVRQLHLNSRLGLISGVISALGTGLVYAYGGYLVQNGGLTIGGLVAITFYIGFIFQPAVRVVDFNTGLQWAIAAMDRVFETLDRRLEIDDKPTAQVLPWFDKQIEYRNVSFKYSGDQYALRNINLTVNRGEVVGIVGPSGAGKSTLMLLLMRFYDPAEGSVLIDGRDLRDVRLDSLRKQMTMVAQESMVFSVSIEENVRYGNRDATREQVIAACKAADLHDTVMEYEEGYDTLIGEHGTRLSGGQRQRLALARALVCDPSILILDDVTSALDGETEAKVQAALDRVMEGRTTFVIAHRLSSVSKADKIVVVNQGEIEAVGTHDELKDRPGTYADIYREQYRSVLQEI